MRFCGWGPDIDAGDGFRFHGSRLARWFSRRCVTDEDIVHTAATSYTNEGGAVIVDGEDNMVVHLQYTERNLGQQFANASFVRPPTLGWTNLMRYDGEFLANSTGARAARVRPSGREASEEPGERADFRERV